MTAHVSAAARAEARRALADALAALKAPTPCQGADRDNWTADDPEVLAEAAKACQPCPVRAECRAAGRGEHWGVWGGFVYGRTHGPAQPRPTPTAPSDGPVGATPTAPTGPPRPPRPPRPTASAERAVLAVVALGTRSGPVTPAELRADLEDLGMLLPNQGIAHVLKTLATAGHVTRRTNARGRTEAVSITDAGRAEAERRALELWP